MEFRVAPVMTAHPMALGDQVVVVSKSLYWVVCWKRMEWSLMRLMMGKGDELGKSDRMEARRSRR